MKPALIYDPPARPLTEQEKLIVRGSISEGAGCAVSVKGASDHAAAKRLVVMGLGTFESGRFTANARGMAAATAEKR